MDELLLYQKIETPFAEDSHNVARTTFWNFHEDLRAGWCPASLHNRYDNGQTKSH